MNHVTQIIGRIKQGDEAAREELLPIVYDELRALARAKITGDTGEQTIGATALVHEAFISMVGSNDSQWNSRGHFFAAAAEAMRKILIEQARTRNAEQSGDRVDLFSLDTIGPITRDRARELVDLDDALSALEAIDAEKAQLVKLKFFVGLSTAETAEALSMSLRTVERSWAYCRAWLYRHMASSE